jgi:NAD-dependent SIR2 family protein deacetylase
VPHYFSQPFLASYWGVRHKELAVSSLFLIGAGASYGSGDCYPKNPPLGENFFEEFKARGGIASTVEPDLQKLFSEDFEKAMDRFFEERNTDVTQFLREMAEYFSQFEPLDNNHYCDLLDILGGDLKKSTFVTTNYDLLIELAVMKHGLLVSYSGLPVPKGNIPIIKIHGSCNFLPDMGTSSISGIRFDISGSKGGSILDTGIKIARSRAEILEFCKKEDAIGPALAMYSPEKRVLYCKSFVEHQQKIWLNEVRKAKRIYVIGLKVHPVDEHIWGVLAKSKVPLYYVGGEPDDIHEWAKENNRKQVHHIANRFDESLPVIAKHLKSKWQSKNA